VPPNPPRHVHIAIIGSGFGGLGAAIRLKEIGENDFLVFERKGRLGGVWRDNSYPGCACDVPSHLYSFSFARNPDWSRSFSPQAEIWEYLERCADRFGVRPHIRFDHAVESATWDDAAQRWILLTSAGSFTADLLVSAVGALSEPGIPALPGLADFKGKTFHSAAWDHAFDLRGKRVAVVGTGASAIQFVPAIQPDVSKMTVFQRTPPWVVPRHDRELRAIERRLLRASPALQWLVRAEIHATRELLAVAFFYPRVAKLVERLARAHLARSVPDAQLREKLTPRYTIGCKRILISNDYYPALTKPNVELVTQSIVRVTETGVVTADGVLHPVDAIIFGTGFQIQEYPFARHVRGRLGKTLAETWSDTMTAHLGTTVAGFPNLFLLLGPNTGLGHTSVILMIEAQLEHLVNAVRYMRASGATSVEPTREAEDAFVRAVDDAMAGTVWTAGGCASWYLDRHGRNSTLWPGFTFTFRRRVAPFDPDEYRSTFALPTARAAKTGPLGRLAFRAARGAMHLPPSVQRAVTGGGPTRRDGFELDPGLQFLLATDRRIQAEWPRDALRLRAERDHSIIAFRGPLPEVHAVRDLLVPGAESPLRARHYATNEPDAPLLLFLHGGGFVFGNLETHDVGCRLLSAEGRLHVLAVEYRLVPEHRFPAPVLDAQAAFAWAVEHAAELGADPSRVGVGGDSAGGNLAAVVSQLARTNGPRPACQILIYPATDRTRLHPSLESLAEGFMLTRASVEWFHAQYAAAVGADSADPRISPLVAKDLRDLPPALVITAGFDPLRDEGEAYARALRAAGTHVLARRFDSLIHGFFNLTGLHEGSREAVVELARLAREMFGAALSKAAE